MYEETVTEYSYIPDKLDIKQLFLLYLWENFSMAMYEKETYDFSTNYII